jgi:tetratricopeptide (TPR) repeat protein
MSRQKFVLLSLLILASCATPVSPEDRQMADALCAQGKSLLASGKTADARDVYASATHRDINNPRAWNGLGVADDLLGKRVEAEDAYEHAVDLAPGDLTALNNLAHLYLENGDPEAAQRLLEPHANDPGATATLKQNLAVARKAVAAKEPPEEESYADIGSFPTEGMAKAHLKEARGILGGEAKELTFSVAPEVKIAGGTPTFTARVTGKPPEDICDELNPQAIPCVPHGK